MSYLKNLNSFEKFCEKYDKKWFYSALYEFYCLVNKLDKHTVTESQIGTEDAKLVTDINNSRIDFEGYLMAIDGELLNHKTVQQVISLLREINTKAN